MIILLWDHYFTSYHKRSNSCWCFLFISLLLFVSSCREWRYSGRKKNNIILSFPWTVSPQLLRNSLLYLICRKRDLSLKTNFELSISRWSLKEDLQRELQNKRNKTKSVLNFVRFRLNKSAEIRQTCQLCREKRKELEIQDCFLIRTRAGS